MLSVRGQIVQRLGTDPALGLLAPGGVWDRPIRAGTGQGATPGAFWVDPADPARVPRLRRTVTVTGGGEVPAPFGETLDAVETYPRVWVYVEATAAGKAALDDIDERVRQLLDTDVWRVAVPNGRPLRLTPLEMGDPGESDEFPGSLVAYRRFRGEYLRS